MPTVPAGSKILVTGANGYIAAWLVRKLLEKGYSVRGTVRSEQKGAYLKKIFADYKDKFEVVVVADITAEGAFDEAVKGVDAIEHTASPFNFKADDPQDLIRPAVNGTVGILKSALNVSSVLRIVVTSSCASILSVLPERKVFTELDWNTQSPKEVEEKGREASQAAKYRASKTLAEKAAWDFYNANKSNVSWDLVVMNPPFVFGPGINEVSSPSELGTSAADWYNTVVRPDMAGKSSETITTIGGGWVDVRDVALAHLLVLEKEKAANERFIISAGDFVFQNFLDAANSLSPSPLPSHTDMPKGYPGKASLSKIAYDSSKASNLLGPELKYHTMEETTRETLADFEERGW